MQRRVAITSAELREHLFDECRLENRVGGADADASGGQAELHFPAVDGIEHARDVTLLHELADGDRHRGRRDAEMVREVAEHHRPLGVEVVHDADLACADADAAFGIADVASVAGKVNAGVIAKDAGDVVGQAHGLSLKQIVSFVNTNNSCAQSISRPRSGRDRGTSVFWSPASASGGSSRWAAKGNPTMTHEIA